MAKLNPLNPWEFDEDGLLEFTESCVETITSLAGDIGRVNVRSASAGQRATMRFQMNMLGLAVEEAGLFMGALRIGRAHGARAAVQRPTGIVAVTMYTEGVLEPVLVASVLDARRYDILLTDAEMGELAEFFASAPGRTMWLVPNPHPSRPQPDGDPR